MGGFDDAGVARADGDLVHLLPFNAKKRIPFAVQGARLPVGRQVIGRMAPKRLQPGMAVRNDAALLCDLPLERVSLRTDRRERRVAIPHHRTRRAELPSGIVGEDRVEPGLVGSVPPAHEGPHPPAPPPPPHPPPITTPHPPPPNATHRT